MASYSLVIKKSAAKELESVPGKKDRRRIIGRIQSLAANPRPPGVEKLSGAAEKYRIRQGDYRVVYEIDDKVLAVSVVKIGHRKDIDRRLK